MTVKSPNASKYFLFGLILILGLLIGIGLTLAIFRLPGRPIFLPVIPIEDSIEGRFCGGIAANLPENQCPKGYKCQPEGSYPDASGKCVKW